MKEMSEHLAVRLAETGTDRQAAARLRYRIFVEELGGDGPLVDHQGRFERDRFDEHFDHLVLVDARRDPGGLDHVVGVYRMMPEEKAAAGFYSEGEFDLSVLKASGRRLLELGRSCVDPAYRNGLAMHLLWQGLADYALVREVEVLFGVASFHGTDAAALAQPLSHLRQVFIAPPDLRVTARPGPAFQPMDLLPPGDIDRVAAMRAVPALIKSYLKLGGFVGEGAFIDRAFNTIDVCLVMDTARMSAEARARYSGRVE